MYMCVCLFVHAHTIMIVERDVKCPEAVLYELKFRKTMKIEDPNGRNIIRYIIVR